MDDRIERSGPPPTRPRAGTPATAAWLLTLALASGLAGALAGCTATPGYKPGCYLNSAVRPDTRRQLEQASERFYGLLRAHQYNVAYAEASTQLRTRENEERVTGAWTAVSETLTIPTGLTLEEIAVAIIPEGSRGPQQLECPDPSDPTGGRRMLTTDQPYQAYLIQTGQVGGQTYNFGSVWFFEPGRLPGQGSWRLSSIGVRPRLALGEDWKYWRGKAREQKERGNMRNAALLYNLTMDLVVPAPWVKPDELKVLMQEQRQIHADDLPLGIALNWKHRTGVEFAPYVGGAEIGANGLVLTLRYEVSVPADTARVAREAPLLADFIRTTFPEYAEVFHEMMLQATTVVDHEPIWGGYYRFKPEP